MVASLLVHQCSGEHRTTTVKSPRFSYSEHWAIALAKLWAIALAAATGSFFTAAGCYFLIVFIFLNLSRATGGGPQQEKRKEKKRPNHD